VGVLVYVRQSVRGMKRRERVRLTLTVSPAADGYFNLTAPWGAYGRLGRKDGNLRFVYASYGTPPALHEAAVTGTGDATEGRFAFHPLGGIAAIYTRGGSVCQRISDDAGLTWKDEATLFASSTHGDITTDRTGRTVRAAYAAGQIQASFQGLGDAAPNAPFLLKDSSLTALAVEDDSFRLVGGPSPFWWLHARILGAGASSLWYCTDESADRSTWMPTTGAVSGISAGLHPGLAVSPAGNLLAWATASNRLWVTRRAPGDTAWSAPAKLLDAGLAELAVENLASCFCYTRVPYAPLVLVTRVSGEAQASEWYSTDEGLTVKRF
jgi:hypothetical protein